MKILVVEDEKDLLNAMVDYLHQSGMTCEKASTLEEALERIDLYDYDGIILDIGLPDGSGLRVIEEMKKKPPDRYIDRISKKFS